MAHHSLLQGISSDKTFQNEEKRVSLRGLDLLEGEDFLECAVEVAEEDDFRRQGLCSTTWPWEKTGRSKQRLEAVEGQTFSQGPVRTAHGVLEPRRL